MYRDRICAIAKAASKQFVRDITDFSEHYYKDGKFGGVCPECKTQGLQVAEVTPKRQLLGVVVQFMICPRCRTISVTDKEEEKEKEGIHDKSNTSASKNCL